MRYFTLLMAISCFYSCATSSTSKANLPTDNTVFEVAYYQNLQKNIVRLHHLLQGTFTAYAGNQDEEIKSWTVSGGDSVVLYSVPLGDINKDGYWIYSYEFMTSLPDAPLYTSIKRLEQIARDTVDVYYYKTQQQIDVQLADLLDLSRLNAKINVDSLVKQEKRVRYVRKSCSHFVGKSKKYEDPDRGCMRINTYDVSPNFYAVTTDFYDKETNRLLKVKKRPNLLVRRSIELKLLTELAEKS